MKPWFLLAPLLLVACKKTSSPGPASGAVSISSIAPTTGGYNTVVTVTGEGFAAGDSCFFNGHAAVIQSVTATTMTVEVPARAGTGNVSVKSTGNTATGPVFTYQYTTTKVTFAGNGDINEVNGQGTAASFVYPSGIALDQAGNLYVTEAAGSARTITPGGLVGYFGAVDAYTPTIDLNGGFPVVQPYDIIADAVDTSKGQLWIADGAYGTVTVSSPIASADPIAGKFTPPGVSFAYPTGIAFRNGILYIVNYEDNLLQVLNANEQTLVTKDTAGLLNEPMGVAVDWEGDAYIANGGGNNILKRDSTGTLTVLAGGGTKGSSDGTGTAAAFWGPQGIAVDGEGNVYVSDSYNQKVRVITPGGVVTSFPYQFSLPVGLAVTPDGGTVYVADMVGCVIYKITIQ